MFFEKDIRIKFFVEFKKYKANTCIFGIVVYKFCHRQKLCPIILLLINKYLEINLYCAILPFNLAIYLNIKCNRELLLDIEEIT